MHICNSAKKTLYEGVIVSTVMYGAEAWGLREAERRRLNVYNRSDTDGQREEQVCEKENECNKRVSRKDGYGSVEMDWV